MKKNGLPDCIIYEKTGTGQNQDEERIDNNEKTIAKLAAAALAVTLTDGSLAIGGDYAGLRRNTVKYPVRSFISS